MPLPIHARLRVGLRAVVAGAAFASAIALPAAASTGQAWEESAQAVRAACIQASGLREARLASKLAIFDDTIAQTAVLVRGRAPQPHMQGVSLQVLCLYDRRSGQARVAEWNPSAPAVGTR